MVEMALFGMDMKLLGAHIYPRALTAGVSAKLVRGGDSDEIIDVSHIVGYYIAWYCEAAEEYHYFRLRDLLNKHNIAFDADDWIEIIAGHEKRAVSLNRRQNSGGVVAFV